MDSIKGKLHPISDILVVLPLVVEVAAACCYGCSMNVDSTQNPQDSSSKVVDLSSFRQKKALKEELSPGRQPLFASHLNSAAERLASKRGKKASDSDFGDRLQRIRASLDKINRLMAELKNMSAEEEKR